MRCLTTLFIFSAFLSLGACSSVPVSNGHLNIVLLGQSAAPHFERGERPYRRAYQGLAGALTEGGHNLFDEAAVALDDFQLRDGLSRDELLDMALSVNGSAEIAVIFVPRVSIERRDSSLQLKVSIEVTVTDIHSGRVLATASSRSARIRAKLSCDARCLRTKIGDTAAIIATDVGVEIARKLGNKKEPTPRKSRKAAEGDYEW